MKILNWYVTKSFLVTFFMAIGVLTFGMAGARLVKIFESMAKGVPPNVAMEVLLYTLPHVLCFTVPWASLVAVMLVFGRMSADSEITAMRACGVSILQIVAPLIVTTIIFTAICLHLQLYVGPVFMDKARQTMGNVAVSHPLALFTSGRPVDMNRFMPGMSMYFASKDSDNNIYYVQVYRVSNDGIQEDATAARGKVVADPETKKLQIILYDAQVETRTGGKDSRSMVAFMDEFRIDWDYGAQMATTRMFANKKYLPVDDLLARIVIAKREGEDSTAMEVELSSRVCLALAPIAFLLLGLPMAIQTSRRETSVGLFLSVLLAGVYFSNVLAADAIEKEAGLYPQYLIWIVPVLYQVFGLYYIVRVARK